MTTNEELQRILDISVKSTNGTATTEEDETLRSWFKQQVTEGKASYDKLTGTYTFTVDNEHSISYSRDVYQEFVDGQTLKQAIQNVRQNDDMTADKCYKTIMSGTSNRTDLDKALEYYALHYDEVNAIDSQDNSLQAQKGDLPTIRNTVLADDYMAEKLAGIAQNAGVMLANRMKYGTSGGTRYSDTFLIDFGITVPVTSERVQSILKDNDITVDEAAATKILSALQSSNNEEALRNVLSEYNLTVDDKTVQKILSDYQEASSSAVVNSSRDRAKQISDALLGNASLYLADQEDFKLPDMGDYYLGNIDSTYLDKISEAYEGKKNAQAAASYAGSVPEPTLGYYKDKDIYFLKAKVDMSNKNIEDGLHGCDYFTLFADQLSSSQNDNTNALNTFIADLHEKTKDYPILAGSAAGNMFELKLIGLDAPQQPRWAYEYNVPKNLVTYKGLEKRSLGYYTSKDYVCSINDMEDIIEKYGKGDGVDAKEESTLDFSFVYINNKWHQAELISLHDDKLDFRWLIDPGIESHYEVTKSTTIAGNSTTVSPVYNFNAITHPVTKYAEVTSDHGVLKKMQDLLAKTNGEIYIRFEGGGIPVGSTTFPAAMSNALVDITSIAQLRKMAEVSNNKGISGFNRIHVQNCRRYLGEAYIKTSSNFGDVYINIAQYLLGTSDDRREQLNSSNDYEGKHPEAFTLQEYDIGSKIYADAFFETIDELDDRKKIQKELFGVDWDSMLDWNVTIGDVTFFVPPVNIRMQTYTHSERMSLLRAKGSAAKTEQQMQRILSMDIFFNEDKGINGYAWSTHFNDSEKTPVTYSLNGLRAIVSMFKFTPFLPISNNFINKTLGIDAIVVTALNMSSVENYPKLIHATLTMAEFNWRVYMPDIVQLEMATTVGTSVLEKDSVAALQKSIEQINDNTDEQKQKEQAEQLANKLTEKLVVNREYVNWFEKTINWQTFRYYYQRPIIRGDFLKSLNYDFNSEEYIYFTCGGLTSLIPMSFQDPGIKFYMANEDYLKEILKARYELLRKGIDPTNISFSEDQLKMLQAIGALSEPLQTLVTNSKFQQDLNNLNTVMRGTDTAFFDATDVIGNLRPDAYYNQGCITNDMSNNPSMLPYINECLAQVDQITEDARAKYNDYFEADPEYMSIIAKDGKSVSFAIAIKVKEGALPDDEMDSFKKMLAIYLGSDPFTEQGNWEGFIDDMMDIHENRIIIPLTIDTQKDTVAGFDRYKVKDNSLFRINGNTPGMKLINTSNKLYDNYSKTGTTGDVVPDVNALMNLVYDEYIVLDENSPGFLVTSWNVSLTNKVASLRALSNDNFAPQYLGGEDINITVHIQTYDKQIATMLTAIPKQISRLTRTYHLVMPCIPLRIDSEFSKFLGVNEVTCEEASISTETGHPGLYNITMHFISMDRTIREREAANKKAINNSGWNYYGDDAYSDYGKWSLMGAAIGSVAGAVGTMGLIASGKLALSGLYAVGAVLTGAAGLAAVVASGAALLVGITHVLTDYAKLNADHTVDGPAGDGSEQSRKYRQYFEMKNALAEIDLYPDLELPSIIEMNAIGFYFTRYKFQDERIYVDPDFYFIYPVKLISHIYRELAIHGMESGIANTTLTDATGACVKIEPNFGTGYTITEKNDKYDTQVTQTKNRKQIMYQLVADQKLNSNENLKKQVSVEMPFMSLLNLTMERDSWSICDQIQGMFLERKFLQEVKSYESTVFASTAGNVDETRGTSDQENTNEEDKKETITDAVETQQNETKAIVHTEGKFVYDELQSTKEAAGEFYTWLSEHTIETTIPSMSGTANKFLQGKSVQTGDVIITAIKTAVSTFLAIEEVSDFLKALKIDINEKFINVTANIIAAAACFATGRKEFSDKTDSEDWKPNGDFIGVQLGTFQNAQGMNEVLWGTDKEKWQAYYDSIVKKGIEFGCFRFKMYTKNQLQDMMYKEEGEVPDKPKEEKYEDGNVNNDHYLLDPGYRAVKVNMIEQYKGKCITSIAYATYAYMRLVCYWLCRLVYMRVLPNISTDVLRSRANLEISIQDTTKTLLGSANSEVMVQGSGDRLVSLRKHIEFFSKNMYVIDAGKMWTATILTSSEGDRSIVNAIEARNYGALNAIVETCSTPSTKMNPINNTGALAIRKITLALVGLEVINSIGAAGSSQTLPGVASNRDTMTKLYIAAAEDPKQFIPHSFHDMIVTDARGRMLRAFPTFYMCFIDEGREIGFWKLHDNFYNVNAISEIEVVKSRKLPTDVCRITMSNFFNSFTTEQEDYTRTPVASIEQAWNSIFSPSEYFKEQEVGRRNKPQDIKLRLRVGARIHVRMGYGNNAAMLPVMFNGIITEVSSENTVNIIAQGDGVELLNPIDIDKEAHNLPNEDDVLGRSASNGASPLQIATALFTTHGGVVPEQIRKRLHLNLSPRNPFGIVHFGDPDFKTFCKTGECCQNLYEMTTHPLYGGNTDITNLFYTMDDITRITFDLFQKTPWDVLNICKSISPDGRLAVLPFGFRSTVFMGLPHFYYAYDYYKDEDNVVKEKRKPFQQWHIYTSEQDIIGNGIVATNRDVKTVAIGLFQICETFNMKSQQRVGPLYADWDIYSEAQKTMVVDTSLLGKGIPFIGPITNFFSTLGIEMFNSGGVDAFFDDTGFIASHKKIAWRSTATALRESVMDMYAGDLIVFGDPSIKPQDRMFIADKYTGLSGQTLVKEVVHHISVEKGFTTAISPDCITIVNDNTELIKYEAMNRIGSIGAVSACLAEDLADSVSWTSTVATMAAWAGMGAAAATLTGFGLTKAGHQASQWFATSNAAKTGLRGAQSALSWLGSKVSSSALTSLASRLGTGLALNSIPFLGQAASVAYFAAMTASVFIMPFINAWVESELKNYKVLTIFPLKKYGYAYIAGFEGARGTVYGSPTWGDRGSLGDVFDFLDGFPIIGSVGNLLFSDEVKTLANKYIKDNNINDTVSFDQEAGRLLSHLAGSEGSFFANTYRSQQLQPRATANTPVAMTNSYNHFKKLDTKNWKHNIGENRMISQDARIVPYLDEKFFLIVHESAGLPVNGKSVTDEVVEIGGIKYRTKAIHVVDGQGNAVIDIPFLNRQALNILYEILRRAKNYMPNANSTDPNENWEATKNDYIVLKSALRIGDRTSMGCTGFTFVLEGTASNSQRALKAALENFDAELKGYKDKEGIQTELFEYKQQDNGEISVRVNMPQVSGQDELESSNNEDSTDVAGGTNGVSKEEQNDEQQTEEVTEDAGTTGT